MGRNWLLKIRNTLTGCKLVIYEDGRVYVDRTGPLIGILKSSAVKKIKNLVAEYLPKIKQYGYEVVDRDGFIIKFWDYSVKKRSDVAVKGWIYEEDVLRILCNKDKFKKLMISEEEYHQNMLIFLGSTVNEENPYEE